MSAIRIALLAAAASSTGAGDAAARVIDRPTWCETIVTGQGPAERERGLGICLVEVLVRVSGQPAVADDPRLEAMKMRARDALQDLEYEDRMKGLPLGDEQGTRDRPFYLRPTFEPAAIEAMLADLGLRVWPADRPVLAVVATAEQYARRWRVVPGVDGVTAGAQVEALLAAGARFGVPLVLPATDDPAPADSAPAGADALLVGHLVWDEAGLGWRVTWTMPGRDVAPWSGSGISFDDAFRLGIGRAAAVLSGAVQPR
ncbi:DUF2066 domain-containing protein [Zavarzinia compransoris]|nr:DUF2066 domain-containing protein [Zavarzinia marina]